MCAYILLFMVCNLQYLKDPKLWEVWCMYLRLPRLSGYQSSSVS